MVDPITKFLSLLENGVSKPSLFRVEMQLPKGIKDSIDSFVVDKTALSTNVKVYSDNRIGMMVHDMTLPGVNLSTFEIFQTAIVHPYKINYQGVTTQIYVDGNFNAYKFLTAWRNMVVNMSNNTLNYYDEFTADITIALLDEKFRDVVTITMADAYPIDYPGMRVASSATNEMQTISVGWSYSGYSEVFHEFK